jgi:hypothetical protein
MGKNWFFKAESFCCCGLISCSETSAKLYVHEFGFSMTVFSFVYFYTHKNQKSLFDCKQQPNGISKI